MSADPDPDRECPADGCRQRFLTSHGVTRHLARSHPGHGKWRDTDVVTDGGTAEHPPANVDADADATLQHRLSAIQLCVHEERWDRAEDGLLHVLAEVRKRKGETNE